MYQTPIAKGSVQVTPAEYLNSLEALYGQRGYRKIESYNSQSTPKRKPGRRLRKEDVAPIRFLRRDETDGIATLSATGPDADYNSEQPEPEPYTFSTIVLPAASGGADWATYRIGIHPDKIAQLSNLDKSDFPGADPVDVPRLSGLQRIYVLKSGSGLLAIYKSKESTPTSLVLRYLEEMPRHGWRLDAAASAHANKVTSGVMCFTQHTRSCLVWVTPGQEPGSSNIAISIH
jgi:hypothetical protein